MNQGSTPTQKPDGTLADFQLYRPKVTTVKWSVSLSSGWNSVIPASDSSQHVSLAVQRSSSQVNEYRSSPSFKLRSSEEDCTITLRRDVNNVISLHLDIPEFEPSKSGTLNGDIKYNYNQQFLSSYLLKEMSISKATYSVGLGWGYKNIHAIPQTSNTGINFGTAGNMGHQFTHNGTIIINLHIRLSEDKAYDSKYEYVSIEELSLLSDNLESLYKNGKFSDVSLIVNEQPLRAHKAILSARSPVLAAMLDSDMTENRTDEIEINDLDVNVVKEMLRFMYTGQVEHLEEVAYGLLTAADKYGLDSLKVKCAASLAAHLSEENVAQIFRLADLHSADQLQKTAADYIKKNMGAVRKTEGWKLLKKSCPELVIDTFIEN